MASIHTIVVCTQDAVLAKKVRILLARHDTNVEVVEQPAELEGCLDKRNISLLILSRKLDGLDMIDTLQRLGPGYQVPPTIILGGRLAPAPEFIHLIADPIDTQAIYRSATEILLEQQGLKNQEKRPLLVPEQITSTTNQVAPGGGGSGASKHPEEQDNAMKPMGLTEIAGQLDVLDDQELLHEAFDIDEPSGIRRPPDAEGGTSPGGPPPVSRSPLRPQELARILYRRWADGVSGMLKIRRDGEDVTAHLNEGVPVFVASSVPGDNLGRALVERDHLNENQYAEAAKRSIERGVALGRALVDLGYLSEEELHKEQATSAEELLVACFDGRPGSIEFSTRPPPPQKGGYQIEVGEVIALGIRKYAPEETIKEIVGEPEEHYFALKRPLSALQDRFVLSAPEIAFLEFGGRAYNMVDAAEIAKIATNDAARIVAVLSICEELKAFTPSSRDFEARIREERQRTKDLESQLPHAAEPKTSSPPAPVESTSPPPRMPPPAAATPPPPPATTAKTAPPPTPDGTEIPPMPVPENGRDGEMPRKLVYAGPIPRNSDGTPQETPEQALSREHFQQGVALLGQGNFTNAEEAFREAVALCAEEHVYLIGLARAIYYNPVYRRTGKLALLKDIVQRAEALAPNDKRVSTLTLWVQQAEARAP